MSCDVGLAGVLGLDVQAVKYLPWLLVVGLLGTLVFGHRHYAERIAQLEHRKAQVDTVYRDRTLTLTKVRRITDSVIQHDTVVRAIIATERQACDAVIQTCEQRVAVRDSLIVELKKKPSVLHYVPWVLGGVAVGLLLK